MGARGSIRLVPCNRKDCDMRGETTLQIVERHVREARLLIARQREIIEELRFGGHPTLAAESLLKVFEETLETHKEHADRLRQESQH